MRAGSGLRDALTSPDDPEHRRLVQPDARSILRKDARLDGPDTGVLSCADEGIEQEATDALCRSLRDTTLADVLRKTMASHTATARAN